jgi:hypothetical protein
MATCNMHWTTSQGSNTIHHYCGLPLDHEFSKARGGTGEREHKCRDCPATRS